MKSKKRSRRWPKFTQNYSTSPNKTIFQIDSIQTDLFDQVLEVPLKRARNNDKLNLIERSGGLLCQVYCRLQMHLVTAAETADQLKDLTKLCESKPGCNRFFALPLSRLYSYSNLKWSVLTSLQLSGGATSYHQPVYLISHSGYQLLTPPVPRANHHLASSKRCSSFSSSLSSAPRQWMCKTPLPRLAFSKISRFLHQINSLRWCELLSYGLWDNGVPRCLILDSILLPLETAWQWARQGRFQA